MTNLEKQILKKREEIRELNQRRAEQKALESKALKKIGQPGRPRISKSLLQKIELEAYEKPLTLVAFKYNVSAKTLYNYGITRQALKAKVR